MDTEIEYELMNGIGKIHGLGQIEWKDQAVTRLADAGIGVGLGFGVGALFALLFPSLRMTRSMSLALAAASGGLAVVSAVTPIEGAFFNKLSLLSGGFAGSRLASAAIGK